MVVEEVAYFQREMDASFQHGVREALGEGIEAPIPPRDSIKDVFGREGFDVWVVMVDGVAVGASIIQSKATNVYELDLLFIFVGEQGKGYGQATWEKLEALYSNAQLWVTHTPYFDRRNIHFYVNHCGFHVVTFYNAFYHPNEGLVEAFSDARFAGFFRFEKRP